MVTFIPQIDEWHSQKGKNRSALFDFSKSPNPLGGWRRPTSLHIPCKLDEAGESESRNGHPCSYRLDRFTHVDF